MDKIYSLAYCFHGRSKAIISRGNHQVVNAVRLPSNKTKIEMRLVHRRKPKDRELIYFDTMAK